MKHNVLFGTVALLAASVLAAYSAPKDSVRGAVHKLASADNYSWTTTMDMGGRFRPGPTNGKTEKDGYTILSMSRRNNTLQVVMKGKNAAIKTPDGWQSLADVSQGGGRRNRGRFMAMMLRNYKTPAAQAKALLSKVDSLESTDGAYTADLSGDAVKGLLRFGRGRGNRRGPEISDAKGSVKFWVTDGVLSKYQLSIQATMNFNGNERTFHRTTTTEIKDVGTTSVDVPDGAKKALSS